MRKKLLAAVCCCALLTAFSVTGCAKDAGSACNMQKLLNAQISDVCVASSGFSNVIYPYSEQEKIGEFVSALNEGGEYKASEETSGIRDFIVTVSFSQKENIAFYINEEGYISFSIEEEKYKTVTPVPGLQEQIKEIVGDDWTY